MQVITIMEDLLNNLEDKTREPEENIIRLLEKQKRELVVRALMKHEEAQAEKIFADKLITSLSDLFFVMSDNFTIVKTNAEFCRILAYPEVEDGAMNLDQLVSQETFARIKDLIAAGEFKSLETELLNSRGEKIRVSMNGSTYITESGRVLHMIIATDKSDVYRMMSRIREAQEQLIHSGRLASLGEMAAGIGHELTQPLNAILLFARNCLKALDEPMDNRTLLNENLNIIIDRVNKASSIIRSLKSFARKRKVDEDVYPIDINKILLNILKFFDSQLKLSDIRVDLHLAEQLPAILGHDVRLEQIFLNLIQNAVQAMGDLEEPHLIISTYLVEEIEPESLLEKKYVVISIKDIGEGIPPEIQGNIFDPFFTTREVGLGMGLGLSIVDRIVRGMSGFIKVDSALGRGACFAVFLPAALEESHGQN